MLINYETPFYVVMVVSIVVAFCSEALSPIDQDSWSFEHAGRNFIIWLLSFLCADFLVGYYWVDIQSIIQQQPFGVFYWISLPSEWMLLVLGVLIIDVADYFYHRISHQNHFLWRLHAVHHTDTTLDISTTLRSHPLDLVASNFWKIGLALVCGVPIWVIGFRELLIFPLIFFQHANAAWPVKLENKLSKVLVTPVLHRLHHSIIRAEHDTNYGEGLILWDKLFGTFQQPVSVRPQKYGLKDCETEKYQTVDGMLLTPLYIKSR